MTTENTIDPPTLEWVAQAAGKNHVRQVLNFVYVADGLLVASDGLALHTAPNDAGLPDGFYDPRTGDKLDVNAQYPDWQRVMPDEADLTFAPLAPALERAEVVESTFTGYRLAEKFAWQTPLVDRAVSGMPDAEYAIADEKLLLKAGDLRAVIMPFRL